MQLRHCYILLVGLFAFKINSFTFLKHNVVFMNHK
nr:MAG TPA: hypothetical protein [Caudoviricetes sp.]